MHKWKFSLIFFLILIVLVGCGQSEGAVPCENPLIPIEVDFTWEPTGVKSGEEVQFKAVVTHDGIPITDANYVEFEFWEHANSEYQFLEDVNNEGNGVYTLNWTFPKDGVYYAYYHVTACSMHRMEKDMVIVGDVDVEKITSEPDTVESIWELDDNVEGDVEIQ